MEKADQEKTTFIIPKGTFCYQIMPFGLKNAGATFQRLVTKVFQDLIGRTVEAYVDDIMVKSKERVTHEEDLQTVFGILRKYKLRLNASKCRFGVSSRKLLGYIVT